MFTRQTSWNWRLLLVIGLPALSSFFLLGQSDLAHTVFSSYSIFQGHFLNFYDFNRPTFVGNDYLPVVYLIFAAWMAPLFLLGLTSDAESFGTLQLNTQELIWAKAGLAIVLVLATLAIHRIAKKIWGEIQSVRSDLLFISSPFTLLAVLALGQFDVIGVLFALLGFERWLKKDNKGFIGFFAAAICFKYFSVIIFLILLALGRDRLQKKINGFFLALLPVGGQILIFSSSDAFRENLFSQANRVLSLDSPITAIFKVTSILVLAGTILIWGQYRKKNDFQTDAQLAIASVIVVLSLFLIFIKWNPQWLLYLVPFWALAANFVRHLKMFVSLQAIGFVGLVFMLANIWTNNLDESMARKGALSFLLPDQVLKLTNLYPPQLLIVGVAVVYLSIAFLAGYAFLESQKKNLAKENQKFPNFLPAGILGGTFVGFLLIPILFTYFAPAQSGRFFSDVSQYNRFDKVPMGQFHSKVLEIPVGASVTQLIPVSELLTETVLEAIEIDMFFAGPSAISIQLTQGEQTIGSRSIYLAARNPNSFPGFSGWTTVTIPLQAGKLVEKQLRLEVRALSGQEIGVWLDTERPETVQLTDAYGKLIAGSITLRFLN